MEQVYLVCRYERPQTEGVLLDEGHHRPVLIDRRMNANVDTDELDVTQS